jgi:hypothetical protein
MANNQRDVEAYRVVFIQRSLMVSGIIIITIGLLSDFLGFGTRGSGFGPGQQAVVFVGISLIVFSVHLCLTSLFKRFLYLVTLIIVILLIWVFWLFPASGQTLNFIRSQLLSQKILIGAQFFTGFLAVVSAGVAGWIAWKAVHHPESKEEFLAGLTTLSFGGGMVILSGILTGIGLELISSFVVPSWPARELRYIKADPQIFNSWGVRDIERTIEKPSGTKRILFLGDSFLENFPYKISNLFISLSCNELAQQGKHSIECVNLGVSATGPRHYLYRMRRVGLKLSPDGVLLFLFMGNDLVSVSYKDQAIPLIAERPLPSLLGMIMPRFTWLLVERLRLSEFGRRNKPVPNENETLKRISEMPYEAGTTALAAHMHRYYFPDVPQTRIKETLRLGGPAFWQELEPRETNRQYLQGWLVRQIVDQGLHAQERKEIALDLKPDTLLIQATVSYIEQISKDLQKRHIPLSIFLIPLAENVDPEYRKFWSPWYQGNKHASWLRVQRMTLFNTLKQRKISVVDLAEVLEGIPRTYRKFDGHWTEKGHQIIAERIAQVIITLNLIE